MEIVAFVVLAVLAVTAFYLAKRTSELRAELQEAADERDSLDLALAQVRKERVDLEQQLLELTATVERLAPLSDVADAQGEASRLRTAAAEEASRLRAAATADAERLRATAATNATRLREAVAAETARLRAAALADAAHQRAVAADETELLRADARQYAREKKERADAKFEEAGQVAARIVEDARARAEETAGDALRAMENAERWVATERAMRNIIQGYGDEYMRSPDHWLDELAEEYDHKEAGQELKRARQATQLMVTQGRAATCDYVEANRRTTAIRFVLDAFNGKVDVILAKTKSDNAGVLEQQIRDAFALVNHNGAAFRAARILPEYLDARLEELKWGVCAYELMQQEREEQKEIKARLREEARAQREYEREMRQVAKEEGAIRKALEKAEAQAREASDEQRAQFEAQLQELQAKLVEAEERAKRAKSMAELTRSGHVYIISNVGSFGEHVFKIGMTRRLEPLDRVRELGDASVPFRFDVHAMIYADDAPALETALHHRFALHQVNKVNPRKEFFRVDLKALREAVAELGVDVHWTMRAEALEYRESQALAKRLEEDPVERQAWLDRQAKWEAYLEMVGEDSEDEDDE